MTRAMPTTKPATAWGRTSSFSARPGGREVNFRAGDTLILYPRRRNPRETAAALGTAQPNPSTHHSTTPPLHQLSVLDAQVVKVVLAEDLGADGRVVLSVRNRRMAPRYLRGHSHWALEPDTYDTFRREWAGLSAFLCLNPERRQRLLARTGPRPPEGWNPAAAPATTAPRSSGPRPGRARLVCALRPARHRQNPQRAARAGRAALCPGQADAAGRLHQPRRGRNLRAAG